MTIAIAAYDTANARQPLMMPKDIGAGIMIAMNLGGCNDVPVYGYGMPFHLSSIGESFYDINEKETKKRGWGGADGEMANIIDAWDSVVNRRSQGYGLAADIWSLGCTVLEMLTHQLPYAPLECMQALFRIGRGIPPPVPDTISRDARDFILQCLQVNPNARPTAAELLDHPFVKRPLPPSSGSASPYNHGRRI
ncbi:unnamed protein product [Ilex paraguariensis]|uniref:Protein kinase domain-containing protein n=1 Tax=Ilex paraguariensis TaxID=185542 RepID=A0ABC8TQG7_9AQUA